MDRILRQLNDLARQADQALAAMQGIVGHASLVATELLWRAFEPPSLAASEGGAGCIPFAQHLSELGEADSQNEP